MLITGPRIVTIGANGPKIGEIAFPKAVNSPEMIKEPDDKGVAVGTGGIAAAVPEVGDDTD